MSVKEWKKFLSDAGLHRDLSAHYADTFSQHRIKMSMLPDLNKDILNSMEITVMGDVISILKHAKLVAANLGYSELGQAATNTSADDKKYNLKRQSAEHNFKSGWKSSKKQPLPTSQSSYYHNHNHLHRQFTPPRDRNEYQTPKSTKPSNTSTKTTTTTTKNNSNKYNNYEGYGEFQSHNRNNNNDLNVTVTNSGRRLYSNDSQLDSNTYLQYPPSSLNYPYGGDTRDTTNSRAYKHSRSSSPPYYGKRLHMDNYDDTKLSARHRLYSTNTNVPAHRKPSPILFRNLSPLHRQSHASSSSYRITTAEDAGIYTVKNPKAGLYNENRNSKMYADYEERKQKGKIITSQDRMPSLTIRLNSRESSANNRVRKREVSSYLDRPYSDYKYLSSNSRLKENTGNSYKSRKVSVFTRLT